VWPPYLWAVDMEFCQIRHMEQSGQSAVVNFQSVGIENAEVGQRRQLLKARSGHVCIGDAQLRQLRTHSTAHHTTDQHRTGGREASTIRITHAHPHMEVHACIQW
jgi:hypothetical protein